MKRYPFALAALLALSISGCGQQAGSPGTSATPTPSVSLTTVPSAGSPSPTTSAPVSPSPSPSVSTPAWPPAGFSTSGVNGESASVTPDVIAVRVGSHDGYDRFVLQFSGGIPSYAVSIQSGNRFSSGGGKGGVVVLQGTAGVVVTLQHINWTAYKGPTEFMPRFTYLREARLIQNFEGTQQWALGIAGTPAVRVFTLSGPDRLVVDVTAT